jgi:hypothetical protein
MDFAPTLSVCPIQRPGERVKTAPFAKKPRFLQADI